MYFLYHVECKRNECLFCNDLRWDRNLKICCPVWIECTEKKLSHRGGWSFKNSIFSNAILHIPKILICKTKSIPRHHQRWESSHFLWATITHVHLLKIWATFTHDHELFRFQICEPSSLTISSRSQADHG